MDKYDVFELTRGRPAETLVVVLQHRLLSDLQTVVVAPLAALHATEKTPRLRPNVRIAGRTLQLQIDRLAAVERRSLAIRVGDVIADSDRIDLAIAMLLNGF